MIGSFCDPVFIYTHYGISGIEFNMTASDGNFSVDLVRGPGQGGSVSQVLQNLSTGVTYFVDFDMKLNVAIYNTTVTLTVGSTTTSVTHNAANTWIQHELPFVATSETATITFAGPSVDGADVGVYIDNVRISTNSAYSGTYLATLGVAMYAGLTVNGTVGRAYLIQWCDALGDTNDWHTATLINLPRSPYLWFDTTSASVAKRFYRSVLVE